MIKLKKLPLFLLISLIISSSLTAQYTPKNSRKQFYGNQRIQKPLYKWVTGDYSRHGIQLSFGPTATFTSINGTETSYHQNDTLFTQTIIPKSGVGFFFELGMVHITKRYRKYIHYYDWGIGYKRINGREETELNILDKTRDPAELTIINGEGMLRNNHAHGRFSIHNVFQLNPVNFLDNALGINLDYILGSSNRDYEGYYNQSTQYFQGNLFAQLHYSLGYGFKVRGGTFVIPSIQLPLIGINEWNGGTPSLHWFSSKYYPVLFTLKIANLFPRNPDRCPAVETNEEDRKRAKEFESR
jgi:hypothetical protein